MLKMLRRLVGEDMDLAWRPCSSLWQVKMDPSQVDQILANLVVNARDAVGGIGNITIETDNIILGDSYSAEHMGCVPGEYILLAITDDGHGIDEETLAHIFEPFFTTKGIGEGTGLGLATVYGIIKQNEGHIDVQSQPGVGTTFRIYIPRYGSERVEEAAEEAVEKLTGDETVLIVEDDEAILNIGMKILGKLGYNVLTANDPVDAVHLVENFAGVIHLLVTDVVMPRMNGRQLKDRLSAIRPGMKCLFMSGYPSDVIAHRGILEESIEFIQKPLSISTLARKVRKLLDK
jgi:CheY-like chemotaxis protein